MLLALGQNPTQAEVAEIEAGLPSDGPSASFLSAVTVLSRVRTVDFDTFQRVLNRPDGYKSAGTAGLSLLHLSWCSGSPTLLRTDEFIRGFQVFDKDGTGYIGVGELRYVLTSLGEKLSDDEVDELLKGVKVGA